MAISFRGDYSAGDKGSYRPDVLKQTGIARKVLPPTPTMEMEKWMHPPVRGP